jgi:hypothetical protein
MHNSCLMQKRNDRDRLAEAVRKWKIKVYESPKKG